MKLTPASRALATIRDAVASFVGPPNIMVPRQIGEIFRPLRPSWRYCMGEFLTLTGGRIAPLRAQAKHQRRKTRCPDCSDDRAYSLLRILNTPLAIAMQRLSTVTSVFTKIRLRVARTTRGRETRVSPIFPASTKCT